MSTGASAKSPTPFVAMEGMDSPKKQATVIE
jgi:hypothetical protein